MDNQMPPNQLPENIKKINPVRIILIVFTAIILMELIWVGYTFVYNKQNPIKFSDNTAKQVLTKKATTMSIVPQKIEAKKGEKITISININSDIYSDGTDISISYDPTVLSIANQKEPVQTASVYNNFPLNKVDEKLGIISVSGVTDKKGGVLVNGIFGTIDFIAKSSGKSKISIDFTPGLTTDSNVINSATGTDVLEKVEDTEVNILP